MSKIYVYCVASYTRQLVCTMRKTSENPQEDDRPSSCLAVQATSSRTVVAIERPEQGQAEPVSKRPDQLGQGERGGQSKSERPQGPA